jgi:AcrR family transcriptional regulator
LNNTKEMILQTALRLFARDGYEAIAVSAITAELGITKSALYKHYKSKREIFDNIVERMLERNAERANEFGVPKDSFSTETAAVYCDTTLDKIKAFSIAQFHYWTEDEFASSFRKMLTLEQYRNKEMADLLNQYLTGGVVNYTQDLIREASELSHKGDKDPHVLALEYFAPIYMLMNLYDNATDKAYMVQKVELHIDYFMASIKGEDSV